MKTKLATGVAIKAADLDTDELKALKGDDADVVAYASVETEDRDKDVVRVAGISLKNHRAESPVKLFASHLRSLPSGESPVIGRVLRFQQVTHKGTGKPALAFAAKFAGTPLGKHYAQLYGEGTQTDFSIGFKVHKAEPLGQDKGLDFKQTELMEVSAVALPANEHASVMRAFDETYPEQKYVQTWHQHRDGYFLADTGYAPIALHKSEGDPAPTITKADFDAFVKQLTSRLDDVTCAVEALASKDEEQIKGRATTPPAQTATVNWSQVAEAFKALGTPPPK